ncbi:MAG: hypothetical protein IJZ07_03160 [Clostridia bacterium]|nr:hypothetical protein [Clostridia bacterium]
MKNKFCLIASVFQSIVGIAGILSFAVLVADGEIELLSKWTITFALTVCFVIIGIKGIKDYKTVQ